MTTHHRTSAAPRCANSEPASLRARHSSPGNANNLQGSFDFQSVRTELDSGSKDRRQAAAIPTKAQGAVPEDIDHFIDSTVERTRSSNRSRAAPSINDITSGKQSGSQENLGDRRIVRNDALPIIQGQARSAVNVRLLRSRAVIVMTGLSRMTIYRLEASGHFPKRIKLGEKAIAWRQDEINDWIQARPIAQPYRDAPALTKAARQL